MDLDFSGVGETLARATAALEAEQDSLFNKRLEVRRDDGTKLIINMPNASYVEISGEKWIVHFGGKVGVFIPESPPESGDPSRDQFPPR